MYQVHWIFFWTTVILLASVEELMPGCLKLHWGWQNDPFDNHIVTYTENLGYLMQKLSDLDFDTTFGIGFSFPEFYLFNNMKSKPDKIIWPIKDLS